MGYGEKKLIGSKMEEKQESLFLIDLDSGAGYWIIT